MESVLLFPKVNLRNLYLLTNLEMQEEIRYYIVRNDIDEKMFDAYIIFDKGLILWMLQ